MNQKGVLTAALKYFDSWTLIGSLRRRKWSNTGGDLGGELLEGNLMVFSQAEDTKRKKERRVCCGGRRPGSLRYSITHRKEMKGWCQLRWKDRIQAKDTLGRRKQIYCLVLTLEDLLWFCLLLALVRF